MTPQGIIHNLELELRTSSVGEPVANLSTALYPQHTLAANHTYASIYAAPKTE